MKNKIQTVEIVRRKWLCHGCGICEAVCKNSAITIKYDVKRQNHIPHIDNKNCVRCSMCFNICPGHEVYFNEISSGFLNSKKHNILAGHYINNYLAWSTDNNIRWRAASGGVATSLAKYCISTNRVDKVIVVKPSGDGNSLDFKGSVVSDENELLFSMGSRYCPVPLCSALKNISKNERIALIGLPCHIQAVRKAQQIGFYKKMDFMLIGIFCGGTKGREATELLIKRNEFDISNLVEINYRGNGWPGQLVGKFNNGKVLKLKYPDYFNAQFKGFRPWRCQLCSDGLAELADISIGDAWLKKVISKNNQGVSIV
jgi:coenzyme F420 hydrogenase subunit beta